MSHFTISYGPYDMGLIAIGVVMHKMINMEHVWNILIWSKNRVGLPKSQIFIRPDFHVSFIFVQIAMDMSWFIG